MAVYQLKNPETVVAIPTTTGNYIILKDNVAQMPEIPKAEFEAKYVPLSQG